MMGIKGKKIINIILTIILSSILFVGCSEEKDETISNTELEHKQTENSADTETEQIDKQNSDKDSDTGEATNDIVSLPKFNIEPDKKVTIVTNWVHSKVGDPDMDLWPQNERILKKVYDIDVEHIKIPAAEMPTKNAAMVMAGNPPDLCSLLAYADYPYSFTNGLYEPLDELLPLDSEIFDPVRKYVDTLRINGEMYWAPHIVRPAPPYFLYNKSLIEEAGLEDPWELVKKNEWDWDTFFNYCKELTVDKDGDGITDQYGAAVIRKFMNSMVNTIGYPVSKIDENNNIEINLRDERLMDYYEFLRKVGPFGEGVFHPLSFKQGDSEKKTTEEFLNGNIGFYYCWSNGVENKTFRPMLDNKELGQLIIPRHPDADKQYIGVDVSGIGISKGAKHPQAAAAYITTYIAYFFNNAKEIKEDCERILSKEEYEEGRNLIPSLNDDYKSLGFNILSEAYSYDLPISIDNLNYSGQRFYIQNKYIKEYPDRVVFDFGQFGSLTNYYAFEQVFSGDANGNPITAQQVIEQIEPQMQEKIDKFQKALRGE